jgi:hypothetical protein
MEPMIRRFALIAGLGLGLAARAAQAQTSYPMLMSVHPVAAQAGQTSEHVVQARYSLEGATQVLVTGEGVTGEIVSEETKDGDEAKKDDKGKKKSTESLTVRFTVAPDAMPGVRDFRIITPRGPSTLGQLVIARDPVVSEGKKNNTPADAEAVTIPCTVCGLIEAAEDVDYYKFTAEAGAALNFHVRSMRLEDKIHDLQSHSDPILTLRSAAGVTLAASDNFFHGDPVIDYQFPQAGEYLLEIRDVRYQGNKYWTYSVEINPRPMITNVYPLGVARGQETQVELIGFRPPGDGKAAVSPPSDAPLGATWLTLQSGSEVTNPLPLYVTNLPLFAEAAGENNTPETAQPVSLEAGINGRIEAAGDIDCFAFEAKKGDRYSFEVVARRQQSALDSHLRILNEKGAQLQLNDDSPQGRRLSSDSRIEFWTAPADGKYVVEIRDLHLRGGADFVYYLEATKSQPYFELYADTDKTSLSPGLSGVIYVRTVRKNGFAGEVQLGVEGLPPGVTADCGRILAGKPQDGCIVLTAAADAAPVAANITITGTAKHEENGKSLELAAVALPQQETYMPGGGRGHFPVEMHTVAVGEPNDIRAVTLSEYEIVLKPGETKQIDVTIERAEGFDKNVTLDVVYKHLSSVFGDSLPEGVTLDAGKSQTLLTGGKTQGKIVLTASAKAPPVEKQLVPLMASAALNFVMKATYSTKPLVITVTK